MRQLDISSIIDRSAKELVTEYYVSGTTDSLIPHSMMKKMKQDLRDNYDVVHKISLNEGRSLRRLSAHQDNDSRLIEAIQKTHCL